MYYVGMCSSNSQLAGAGPAQTTGRKGCSPHRVRGHKQAPWCDNQKLNDGEAVFNAKQSVLLQVKYECLSEEIKIGDYYLRLLLEEDETEESGAIKKS